MTLCSFRRIASRATLLPWGQFSDNVVLTFDSGGRLVSWDQASGSDLDSLALTEYYDGVFVPRLIDTLGEGLPSRASLARGIEILDGLDLASGFTFIRPLQMGSRVLADLDLGGLMARGELLIGSSQGFGGLLSDLTFLHSSFGLDYGSLFACCSYGVSRALALGSLGTLTLGSVCGLTLVEGLHSGDLRSRLII